MALPINIQKLIARETVESERIDFKKGCLGIQLVMLQR